MNRVSNLVETRDIGDGVLKSVDQRTSVTASMDSWRMTGVAVSPKPCASPVSTPEKLLSQPILFPCLLLPLTRLLLREEDPKNEICH